MELVGKSLGQYQIVERIGQGGMASVYKAYQPALGRHVAVKVLSAQHALVPGFSERFEREARAIAALNHPNILPIYEYGQAAGLTYIVMKHVAGGTLADRLRRPLDLPTVVRLVDQMAGGLDHAHRRGVIHRDVKPSNVLLDEGEWVQLADFGLAKIVASDQNLTATGMGMGTPAYLSPEQGQGLPLDHHADIYSLGVIVYEMVTGRLPFSAPNLVAMIFKHVHDPPPAPRSIKPDTPDMVAAVVLKGLAKPIPDRFHSAGELAHALRQAVTRSGAMPGSPAAEFDPRVTPVFGVEGSAAKVSTLPHSLLMMETVPAVPKFVGRERELAAFRSRLDRERFVAVTGMAGVGKTTLAARLARDAAKSPDHIFWFTFDRVEKSTADSLFWALAAFLDGRGDSTLWRHLQNEVGAQQPLDRTVKANLLLAGLTGGEYMLCFDDVHLAADMPDVSYVFRIMHQRFNELQQRMPSRILVVGREVPADMQFAAAGSLSGFDFDEAAAFARARGWSLPEARLRRIWERTQGNAKLLDLAAAALAGLSHDEARADSFVEALARRGEVRDYLMTNIYSTVSPEDRLVLGALSVFPGPIEWEAAESVLGAEGMPGSVPRIDALLDRQLLSETEDGRLMCHSLVRDYAYHVLDRQDRDRYHRSAAAHYEREANFLAAAYHYYESRAYGTALDVLLSHSQAIANGGGTAALADQLARFQSHVLSREQRVSIGAARADVCRWRGEFEQAIQICRAALDEAADDRERAQLLFQLGRTYEGLEEYAQAEITFEQSRRACDSAGDRAGSAEALLGLGWAGLKQGHLEPARDHFSASREIGEDLNDPRMVAKADLGLGELAWRSGRLEEARERLERSRRTFRLHGDRRREALALGDLGVVCHDEGDAEHELEYTQQAFAILNEIGDVRSIFAVSTNLGYLHYRRREYEAAARIYEQMIEMAQLSGHRHRLSMAYAGLSEVQLARGDSRAALELAQQALQAAEQIGPGVELGLSASILGDIYLDRGEAERAIEHYVQAIPLLEAAYEMEDLARAQRGLERARALARGDSAPIQEGG